MRRSNYVVSLTIAAVMLVCMSGFAQEVELPFTWKGMGVASVLSQDGTNDIDFQIELSVDESENLQGKAFTDDGSAAIKHLFYGAVDTYEVPGFYSRKLIMVLLINEGEDNPLLAIMNGRILMDRFFYGEVSLKKHEAGSDVAEALGADNVGMTEIDPDYLPSDLKSALKECMPLGAFKIVGSHTQGN